MGYCADTYKQVIRRIKEYNYSGKLLWKTVFLPIFGEASHQLGRKLIPCLSESFLDLTKISDAMKMGWKNTDTFASKCSVWFTH